MAQRYELRGVRFSYFYFTTPFSQRWVLHRLMFRPTGEDTDITILGIVCAPGKEYKHLISDYSQLTKALYEMSGLSEEDIEFGDVVWANHFSPQIRMVDRFQSGRVLVAGGESFIIPCYRVFLT